MAITTIDDKHLSNIATAIRQKRGVEDTFKPSEMASAIKNISGGEPILQEVVVQPSINEQTITPSADYDGLSRVKIGAVTSSIDGDIQPENIKKGIEILGVVGTIEDKPAEPVLQNKSVEPSTGKQIITADSGYDGLGQVTVNEVTSKIDSNIKADNIKQGVSILGVQGTLEQGAEVVKKYKPRWVSFQGCREADMSEETKMLDTSLFTRIDKMFASSGFLKYINIREWDTSNVTTMDNMFYDCTNLINVGAGDYIFKVDNFDTSQVTSMMSFLYGTSFKTIDLSNFNTSKVISMSSMFANMLKAKTINVSNFDTSNVKYMDYMFSNANSIVELDLSNFVTSNVTTFRSMFSGCKSLKKLDIRNLTFDKVTNMSSMFNNVPLDCLIIVKSDTERNKILNYFGTLTNIKTLAEYQAEGGV